MSVRRAFVIFGPVLFVTIFLHELGHCLATRQARLSLAAIFRSIFWQCGDVPLLFCMYLCTKMLSEAEGTLSRS